MKKQWLIVTIVVVLLSVGAYAGLKLSPDIFPVEAGSRAPDFKAVDIETGDTVSLDQYRGQVVLLNVWATWCAPCREEMPSIQRLHQQLADSGLKVVAVSVDESDVAVVKAFRQEFGLTFRILHDKQRTIDRIYQTTGWPETFVLNRQGLIVKKRIGADAWDSPVNRDLIRRLLAQRG